MKINFSHVRERAVNGGWVNFVVFATDARVPSSRPQVLAELTSRVRRQNLRVDQSALAFTENGTLKFFGDRHLVDYLSDCGLPQWTHEIDV